MICSPNNFCYDAPLPEGIMRVTSLANYDRWRGFERGGVPPGEAPLVRRLDCVGVRFVPDFRSSVVDTDMFTPTHDPPLYVATTTARLYGAPRSTTTV